MYFDNRKIKNRFFFVIILTCLMGISILGKALYMMTVERAYWTEVSSVFVKENVIIPAKRGNILSDDGHIMSGSLPEYRIYMDFIAHDPDSIREQELQHQRDQTLSDKLDSIAEGLAAIFPDKTAQYFRTRLQQGRAQRRRYWRIYPGLASYIQYKECKKLPLLRETRFAGGFFAEEVNQREKPYGSLATRTLGDLYAGKDSARYGLELSYDSVLRGTPGISHRSKVLNTWVPLVDTPPVDGCDILTTIDVRLQDLAEKALLRMLKKESVNGEVGVAVLMETATGNIKAIVNMTKAADGNYYEMKNNAVADLLEPGSTFKTASIMVALEDGKISIDDVIDTGNGQYPMYRRVMKDHNWTHGGYGVLTVPEVLMYSSNVGVSRLIDEHYHDHPEQFVDGLYREGVGIPLNIPLNGAGEPRVRRPKADGSNWYNTALPWMSIGYETQLTPIATLTFYNAIANGGKMVRPRFVTAAVKNGEVVKEYPVEVIKEQICSPKTLKEIQTILERVVSEGLGKKAGSKLFKVSGKTGTAQIAQGAGGYTGGRRKYLVSFCGYFPSDKPKYSCIVAIQKYGLPASGGSQCGPVFKEIAQAAMAQGTWRNPEDAADSTSSFLPDVLAGDLSAAESVLKKLNIPYRWSNADDAASNAPYGTVTIADRRLTLKAQKIVTGLVPNVIGMGAKDALYLLEEAGLNVKLTGVGKVTAQSLPPLSHYKKGDRIQIILKK